MSAHAGGPALAHSLTGAPVELYDPARHEDACWKQVACTRCGRVYVCAPWDDYMTPAADLNHAGNVCEPCLYGLAAAKAGPR